MPLKISFISSGALAVTLISMYASGFWIHPLPFHYISALSFVFIAVVSILSAPRPAVTPSMPISAILAFAIYLFVQSSLITSFSTASILYAARTVFWASFALLLYQFLTERQLISTLKTLMFFCLTALTLSTIISLYNKSPRLYPLGETNPNFWSTWLLAFIVLQVTRFEYQKKFIRFSVLTISLFFLTYLGSRSAILSAAIFLTMNTSSSLKEKSVLALILTTCILFATGIYFILGFEFYQPMIDKIMMEEGSFSKKGSRIVHLQTTIEALIQTPQSIFFGYGIANEDALSDFSKIVGGHVLLHSIFLQLLFGAGLASVVAFIFLIKKLIKHQKKYATIKNAKAGFWLIVSFLIHATFHPMLFNPVLWTLIPLFLAITAEKTPYNIGLHTIRKSYAQSFHDFSK